MSADLYFCEVWFVIIFVDLNSKKQKGIVVIVTKCCSFSCTRSCCCGSGWYYSCCWRFFFTESMDIVSSRHIWRSTGKVNPTIIEPGNFFSIGLQCAVFGRTTIVRLSPSPVRIGELIQKFATVGPYPCSFGFKVK